MNVPQLAGLFRRSRLWPTVRRIVRLASSLSAGPIHFTVMRAGPRFVTANLWLKHSYDHATVYIDPRRISRHVQMDGWRRESASKPLIERLQAWYLYGDGLKSARTHVTRNLHGKFVAGGDWDIHSKPFEVLPVVNQLFGEGRPLRETDEYQNYLKRIEAGQLAWTRGCRNQAELDDYYARLVRAFEDIRVNGYRTQTELGESGIDEIRVCVDRHGEIAVYGGGTHRLSIARFLDLDVVPVSLKKIHSSWLASIPVSDATDDVATIRRELDRIGFQTQHMPSPKVS